MHSVLIVDDDAQNLYMLEVLLAARGYAVSKASNGAEALEAARAKGPDLVVSDILMPVMDGFELCRQWKADPSLRVVPFVFYTATYTDAKDEEFALKLGADRFIVKPQEPDILLGMLEAAIGTYEARETSVPPPQQPPEAALFREYSQVLIHKLEQKMLQLEREVAARREVEAGLRASEERHRLLFETMLQGVVYQDQDGSITDANPAAERLLGLTVEQMRGCTPHDLRWATVHEDGSEVLPQTHPSAVALRTGRAVEDMVMGICDPRDNITRWVRVDTVPLFRPDEDAPHGVYAIFDDITEMRRSEDERELSASCIQLLSRLGERPDALREVLSLIRSFTGVDAIGVRLREGEAFPYRESIGFPSEFLARDGCLCSMAQGGIQRKDVGGAALPGCVCADVVGERTDATRPYFTDAGSFWTNSTSALLSSASPEQGRPAACKPCIEFGYQSVALIPLRTGAETIGLLQLNDGRPNLFSSRLVRFLEGLGNTIGIALARKHAEDALRESEELYRRIVQDQTEMICRCLPDGTIVFANGPFSRFLRRPEDSLVGTCVHDLVSGEAWAQLAKAVEGQTPSHPVAALELPFAFPDGRSGWTRWTLRSFFDEGNVRVASQATGSDVTSEKMAEEEHRLAAVGQLAAGVAHDVNNLLQAMGGTAELVELGRADAERLVQIVRKCTRSGGEIARNLMAFARPEAPRREAGHLEQSLEAALTVASRQLDDAEVSVVRQYDPGGRTVVFDAAQMQQVFLNLIINASHAMAGGGTLTVATGYGLSGDGTGEAIVRISDTGTGIAPEYLDRVFEPFFTTKGRLGESEAPGSGLGLSVSRGLVTAHGGTIGVSSEPGAGARFEIRLPLTEQPSASSQGPGPGTRVSLESTGLHGARLLVAEDDPDVLEPLRRLFESLGCEVVTVATAGEAMEAMRRQEFSLVLSDLMLPGGGGRAIADFRRSMGDNAPPLIVISGRLERALQDEMIALGAARFVEKPFSLRRLLQTASELLGSPPG